MFKHRSSSYNKSFFPRYWSNCVIRSDRVYVVRSNDADVYVGRSDFIITDRYWIRRMEEKKEELMRVIVTLALAQKDYVE